jgi:hypothetical protein
MRKRREFTRRPLAERFWERVNKGNDCWVWVGNRLPKGYGRMCSGGKSGQVLLAHRVSWALHNGPIPTGKYICHTCDNPPCVNPNHLFLASHAENMADMVAKGRARPRGRLPKRLAEGTKR